MKKRKHPALERMAELDISSVYRLAQMSGTPACTLSLWLRGKRGLSVQVGYRVAKALQIDPAIVHLTWPGKTDKPAKPSRSNPKARAPKARAA